VCFLGRWDRGFLEAQVIDLPTAQAPCPHCHGTHFSHHPVKRTALKQVSDKIEACKRKKITLRRAKAVAK
jgi:hypothetical protein